MPKNTFPAEELHNADVGEIVQDLRQLYRWGGHVRGDMSDDALFRERISCYFDFCAERQMRPGVEGMALALGVTRQTILNWRHGIGSSQQRQNDVQQAYQLISASLEQMGLQGKISPPSYIWLSKNWQGYTDCIRIEADTTQEKGVMSTPEEIAARYADAKKPELPPELLEPEPDFD